ncbi:hypothetical protein JZO81_19340 [Enterococcus hulanensis]|uniref:hypothetical protein n=1 Tax=Enterococcus TaxID=1350 RepID=UPI000B5A9999|nr:MULTISPECIES: hypothetical protein [Enterococcus]MBO0413215.1 hypothetical protein [Enterococcus hulanensis]OTO15118.1 hypothetical protein A5875_004275 [Enterococcus sp. 3H8_DIV0648]
MRARKKPVIVDVIPTANRKITDILEFCEGKAFINKYDQEMYIETLEGRMKVGRNDFIIKGVNGEFYPCKAEIFDKTYEIVSD